MLKHIVVKASVFIKGITQKVLRKNMQGWQPKAANVENNGNVVIKNKEIIRMRVVKAMSKQ